MIDKNKVEQELEEKYNERMEIAGFYDGMREIDEDKLESMVKESMAHKPESAKIDHLEIRFTEWDLPKVTIWTKKGLDIEENLVREERFSHNYKFYSFQLDIRPF